MSPPTWCARAANALRRLADRPAALFVLLLAINGLARPYAGLVHDARLYSVQALNQVEGGAYADDLFFRFGSQDQFSLFSRAAVPLVGALGVKAAFFALYLAFNSLFLLALMRLVLALVADRAAAVLALVYLAVTPLPFGGLDVFYVHEPFLTPRINANGLTLLALERMVNGRHVVALGLLVPALLMHPLMAFGGLLIWAGYVAATYLGPRTLVALATVAGLAGITTLAVEPVGVGLFGRLDAEWAEVIRGASIYNFPAEWDVKDWLNAAVSFAVVVAAALAFGADRPPLRRFLLVTAAVGAVGLLGTVLGSVLPYALLFQGQPYRVLWVLKVLQVALGAWLIAHWADAPSLGPRLASLGLLAFLGTMNFLGIEAALLVLPLPVLLLRYRGLDRQPERADWLWRAGAHSILLGGIVWAAYKAYVLVSFRGELLSRCDTHEFVRKFAEQLGPAFWVLLVAVVCVTGTRALKPALVGAAVVCQLAFFWLPVDADYQQAHLRFGPDVEFVRDYLADRSRRNGSLPTVYSSLGRVEHVWVDLHCKSYFDSAQVVGVLFSRQTALEGRRRATVVGAFEMQRLCKDEVILPASTRRASRYLFAADAEPTADDLAKLCQEPGVDLVIVPNEFPGLVTATNGRVCVYDCRQVRVALRLPEPSAVEPRLARALSPSIP